MKVLIHALGADTGGAVTHLTHFISALERVDSVHKYWVVCRDQFTEFKESSRIKFCFASSRVSKNVLTRLYFDNVKISRLIKENEIDLLVSLTNFGPLKVRIPHILFQRNPLYFSIWYRNQVRGKEYLANELRSKLTYFIMKNASLIVAPSTSMADMITESYPSLRRKNIKTLYHGFNREELVDSMPDPLRKVLDFSGLKIVFTSVPKFHKGIFLLFDALRILKRVLPLKFKCYVTFTEKEALESYAHLEKPKDWGTLIEDVVFLGRIPQSRMKALYETCDLMFYPSLCESFGFPLVEAMGAGLPIVAVDTPIHREICQDAAVYFSAENLNLAAEQIKEIATSQRCREALKEKSELRINGFDWSWERYCQEFEALLSLTTAQSQV